jgi:acetamidase/formamidase
VSRVADAVREIRTDRYSFVFGPYAEPIATVRPGELLDIFTEDAFGSRMQSEADLPTQVLDWPYANPQTGPIFVEGAEKGDTLVAEIVDIEPTRDFVASAHIPNFGGLTGADRTAMLNDPLPEQVFIYPLVPGPFGGNMDVPDVCPGNTIHLQYSVVAKIERRFLPDRKDD